MKNAVNGMAGLWFSLVDAVRGAVGKKRRGTVAAQRTAQAGGSADAARRRLLG